MTTPMRYGRYSWLTTCCMGAALLSSCSGPTNLETISFCGKIYASPRQLMTSGGVEYHVVWETGGVTYDSDYYGNPTAEIRSDGEACFRGGAGFGADMVDFKLLSLTVRVHGEDGIVREAAATHLRFAMDSARRNLNACADFVVDPVLI